MKVGFSGHQRRANIDWEWVRGAITEGLARIPGGFEGLCSLAAGADQVFAKCVHAQSGRLVVIVPRDDYEVFFDDAGDLDANRELLRIADRKIELHDSSAPERSFLRAGEYVTENADALMVVWDGKPAEGLGGTADIVRLARRRKCPVLHINPVSRVIRGGKKWHSLFS